MQQEVTLIATSAFGLEAITAMELKRLGFQNTITENGKVTFQGDLSAIPYANLWLRTADRVLLKIGEFKATTFEELFQETKKLPWHLYLPENAAFPVSKAKSVKSKLFSLSDCQAIVKKAIVESLKTHYGVDWFSEEGPLYPIMVSILKDTVTLTIDTSGTGLHKRGYRQSQTFAPIKETLAAGLIYISKWHPDRTLYDPFCGSGTIPIEAAMIGRNIAPGLNRHFAFEEWSFVPKELLKEEKVKALKKIDQERELNILASDKDYKAIKIASENAFQAGVDDVIKFQKLDFKDFSSKKKYAYVITNPPYGERLGEKEEAKALYTLMGKILRPYEDTWSICAITSHEEFEKCYGEKGKNRKLYNGKLKTYFYQYIGPIPPKKKENDAPREEKDKE